MPDDSKPAVCTTLASSETAVDSSSHAIDDQRPRPSLASSISSHERDPLLRSNATRRKPFYRPRPLWLVPFAITAALVRGMTIAPRVEVYTQLSCARVHHHQPYNHTYTNPPTISAVASIDPLGPHLILPSLINNDPFHSSDFSLLEEGNVDKPDDEDDPGSLPSSKCLSDPEVQARAARLQTSVTITMGLLSAIATGWWGHFGERHGRTRVLAISTFGLFLTDLTFFIVSSPKSPLSGHEPAFLILTSFIEGCLGGWSTLHLATSAYVSDCTSPGSRATIFARFTGMFYLGFSLGPSIGGWIIRNRIGSAPERGPSVTAVFGVAAACSLINLILVLFLFPESLSKEKRDKAAEEYRIERGGKGKNHTLVSDDDHESSVDNGAKDVTRASFFKSFFSPLSIFLPATIVDSNGLRLKRDWSLTLLAIALFSHFLSLGVFQVKYLYAEHIYGWGAEQLSYYVSLMGAARCAALLLVLPIVVATFKSKPKLKSSTVKPGEPANAKPKVTKSHLAREIHFDLLISKFSLLIDVISQVTVVLCPAPTYKMHLLVAGGDSTRQSQALFVAASSLSSIGAGFMPAVQSMSLCIVQARALLAGKDSGEGDASVGKVFGALSVLMASGQMILGPMLFGLVYSGTVARYPKAIFVLAAGILSFALTCMFLVRSPVQVKNAKGNRKGKNKANHADSEEEQERGRSRATKDLFETHANPQTWTTSYGASSSGNSTSSA